jgi:hypothetical protein
MERAYGTTRLDTFETRWMMYSCAGSLLSRFNPVTEERCIMHVGLNALHAYIKATQRMYVKHAVCLR